MARPKTRGDTIAVQLPLDVDGLLRALAEGEGVSAGKMIADIVGRWVVAGGALVTLGSMGANTSMGGSSTTFTVPTAADKGALVRPTKKVKPPRREANIRSVPDVGCEHKRATVVAGGLRRCVDCGAVRGVDMVWRGSAVPS